MARSPSAGRFRTTPRPSRASLLSSPEADRSTQQTESVIIDRPPAEVWALVGDVRNWTKWLKDISDVELVSGELETGADDYIAKPFNAEELLARVNNLIEQDTEKKEFQSQTDGELFYKTTEGRDEMPSFKKTIKDDEDRWLIVNYMRTL